MQAIIDYKNTLQRKYFNVLKMRYILGSKGRFIATNTNLSRQRRALKAIQKHTLMIKMQKIMQSNRQQGVKAYLFNHWYCEMDEKRNLKEHTEMRHLRIKSRVMEVLREYTSRKVAERGKVS